MSDQVFRTEQSSKVRQRDARRTVTRRLAAYYHSLLNNLDRDAEGFFERVMELQAERNQGAGFPE